MPEELCLLVGHNCNICEQFNIVNNSDIDVFNFSLISYVPFSSISRKIALGRRVKSHLRYYSFRCLLIVSYSSYIVRSRKVEWYVTIGHHFTVDRRLP
jgi:hypothetical protein